MPSTTRVRSELERLPALELGCTPATLEAGVDYQERLFEPLPSHIYLAAHWAPGGWSARFMAQTPTRASVEGLVRSYELLGAGELLDVASSELARILRV